MQRIEEAGLNFVVVTFFREVVQFLSELLAVSRLNDRSALVLDSLLDVDARNVEDVCFALCLFWLFLSSENGLFAADVLENIVHLERMWASCSHFAFLFCTYLRKL